MQQGLPLSPVKLFVATMILITAQYFLFLMFLLKMVVPIEHMFQTAPHFFMKFHGMSLT